MNRALMVGINAYPGNELNGCINDVSDMASFLVSHCGFNENDIRLLTDARATNNAIVDHLKWLVNGLKSGDRIVFQYSGHGAQFPVRDASGKVVRIDECICPVDFDWTDERAIRDKEFNQLFSAVPKSVEFTWISDSCYSGDLARGFELPKCKSRSMPMPADIAWRMRTAETIRAKRTRFEHVMKNFSAILVSGCTAHQTSADTEIDGHYHGALTYYLLKTLSAPNGLTQTLQQAIARTTAALQQNGYTQRPQLEGAEHMMDEPFLAMKRQKAAAA